MAWLDFRDALQDAVSRAADLPPERVLWAWQGVNQPALEYVTLGLSPLQPVGQDWIEKTYSVARPQGQEFRARVRGVREVTINLQVFTGPTVTDDEGRQDALDLADRITTGISTLPNLRALLKKAGAAVFDPGPVDFAPAVVATNFRGRATASARCYVPPQIIEEYYGYIARISGTISISGERNVDPDVIPYSIPPET